MEFTASVIDSSIVVAWKIPLRKFGLVELLISAMARL
jgi:hypothetical protein